MITLGMEEEIQIIDAYGQLVAHDFAADFAEPELPDGQMDREIHRCVIEVKTRICHTVPQLLAALRVLRAQARRRAATPVSGLTSPSRLPAFHFRPRCSVASPAASST